MFPVRTLSKPANNGTRGRCSLRRVTWNCLVLVTQTAAINLGCRASAARKAWYVLLTCRTAEGKLRPGYTAREVESGRVSSGWVWNVVDGSLGGRLSDVVRKTERNMAHRLRAARPEINQTRQLP